jgi:hypothetical protein
MLVPYYLLWFVEAQLSHPHRRWKCLPRRACWAISCQHGSVDLALQVFGVTGVCVSTRDGVDACDGIHNLTRVVVLAELLGYI